MYTYLLEVLLSVVRNVHLEWTYWVAHSTFIFFGGDFGLFLPQFLHHFFLLASSAQGMPLWYGLCTLCRFLCVYACSTGDEVASDAGFGLHISLMIRDVYFHH